MFNLDDNYFMKTAIREAEEAFIADEVPVGAVIVSNGHIIAKAHNLTQKLNDVTAHAEMQAITMASNTLGAKYLTDCVLYVTLEPCIMCAGAIAWSQLAKIVYAASDTKKGFSLTGKHILHPKTEVVSGLMQEEATQLLQAFFRKKR